MVLVSIPMSWLRIMGISKIGHEVSEELSFLSVLLVTLLLIKKISLKIYMR